MSIHEIFGFDEICGLSEETQTRLFKNPDTSAERINGVGVSVLKQFTPATDRVATEAFLKSVVYLNNTYQERFKKRPFNETIIKLQMALKKTGLSPSEMQPSSIKLEQQFRAKLNSLDLRSRFFASEIGELIAILGKLEKIGAITPGQKLKLEDALQSLRSKTHFRESFFERRALNVLCEKSQIFKTAMAESEMLLSKTNQEGQSLLLKYLKQSDLPLKELVKTIPVQLKEIEKKLIASRLDIIISKMPVSGHSFGKAFIANFYLLMNALEDFELNIAYAACNEGLEKALTVLDPEKNGELLKVLKEYPNLDPTQAHAGLLLMAEQHYVKPLSIDDLCTLNADSFNKKIMQMNEGAFEKVAKFYVDIYKKYFLEMHCWIAENLKALKKVYSQSAHDSLNMGEGTCFQNSLERQSLLLADPYKDGTQIPMGSSAKGRMMKAAVNHSFSEAKKGRLSIETAANIQLKSPQKFGLKGSETLKGVTVSNLPKAVIGQLDGFSKKGFRGIIIMESSSGAHAFNIQIDPQLKIFRFIDDNMGVCEWKDYKQFREQFYSYLNAFYSDYNRFSLEQYTQIK